MRRSSVTLTPRRLSDAKAIRQIPFATAAALNETAKQVKRATEKRIDQVFDRPTPFTRRGVAILFARKSRLTASIIIKDAQARYLARQELGGTRYPTKRALLIPAQTRVNAYGNIPRNQVKRLMARSDVFSDEINGTGGIWQRTAKGLKLLIRYEDKADYRPRFGFLNAGRQVADRMFAKNYRRALRRAIRTAR